MYDELIKRIRNRRICIQQSGCLDDFPLLQEAADAIDELLQKMQQLPRWIPVTERLPNDGVYVLGRYANNDMAVVCVFDHDENLDFWRAMVDEGWETDCDVGPTHWMPLPNPPREGKT